MLIQATLDGLKVLKLHGMLSALEAQMSSPDVGTLSFEERLGMLVDNEITSRDNRQTSMRLKLAKLTNASSIEEFDTRKTRGVERAEIVSLATSDWLRRKQNVIVQGPTGVGKSFLASALAHKACRDGFSVYFERSSRLFQELSIARADGRYRKLLSTIAGKDLLVIDDFGLFPLTEEQQQDLMELVEDRYARKSILITAQLPVDHWHGVIGEPTTSDAILDRIVHNAHKINLKGESIRKEKRNEMQLAG